jgi:hypothetical protein
MRRYLYLNPLEIAEPEVLDYVCGSDMIETKPIVAKELIEEATSLGIDLEKLATYLKKTVDKLTNEDLSSNIAKKRAQLAKKAKAQTSE